MRRRALPLLLLALAGCSLNNLPMPRATYAPVADVRLYARIATIPGVVRAGVRWSNSFDFPNGYRGTVYVVRAADATTILDRSLAILRQGRPGADLGGIEVLPEGAFATFPSMFGLETQADYTARYGPQPGSGTPPRTPLMRVGDPVNTPQS